MNAMEWEIASSATPIRDWKTICCALDLFHDPTPVVEAAADLCRFLGAKLIVLHAARRGHTPFPGAACAECDRELDYWKGRALALGVRDVTVQTVLDEPIAAILGFARDHDVDAIMMGAPGAGRLRHLFRRSVVDRVACHAPCAVLMSRGLGNRDRSQRPSSVPREPARRGRGHLHVVK